jgi:ribonuclease HII
LSKSQNPNPNDQQIIFLCWDLVLGTWDLLSAILLSMNQAEELIAGIDEAGRGALAGPVVAGCCIIQCELFRRRHSFPRWSPFKKASSSDCSIADSKLLSPQEREKSYDWITKNCFWGVGIVDSSDIENIGILRSTEKAMNSALQDLRSKIEPSVLFIDGRDAFHFPIRHTSFIKGDRIHPCIAAGSIIAKVTRDRIMTDYRHVYSQYGFEKHKGYGSEEHIASIKQYGPCKIHRLSFLTRILAPVQQELL